MKNRYFIELSFRGTAYHGWQAQKNAVSVQSVLENALQLILGEDISLTGAGRTDAGVHAGYFVAHFDVVNKIDSFNTVFRLNRFLSPDISVFSIREMHAGAHARFDALSRTYKYLFCKKKNVFAQGLSTFVPGEIDLLKMNMAAMIIKEQKDFTSFSKLHSNNKTNICTIMHAEFSECGDFIVFEITADRFLRNMVRSLTSTLLAAGHGKLSLDEVRHIVVSKDRRLAKGSAPAMGLFLADIKYPVEFLMDSSIYNAFGLFQGF